jgi:prepilin-type N-terminal cleavage/methylation domain-containing protein
MSKLSRNNSGFTLLEIIIVLAVFSMIIVVWMDLFMSGLRIFPTGLKQSEAVNNAQRGIKTMVKEIRNATMGDNGAYVLEQADDFSLIFYSDIDKDGGVERVRYFMDNTKFKKGVIEPTGNPIEYPNGNETISTIAQNINNGAVPVFYYYDGDNNILPTAAILTDTKMMKIHLEIDTGQTDNYILESYVQIRNLKTNL